MDKFDDVIATIAAMGGLGLAAMALVDALKAVPGGGVSRIGFSHIRKVLRLFDKTLARAAGAQWEAVIMAHWINGRDRDDQVGAIRSLLRLGLNPDTADQLAAIGNVDPAALGKAVVFGPHMENFAVLTTHLLKNTAAVRVRDGAELETTLGALLQNPGRREDLGRRGGEVLTAHLGATRRTAAALSSLQKL